MGLDTVELLMNVEDAFDITIPDEQASEVRTVGDLYNLVLLQTERPRPGTCLTASTFYELRAGLVDLGVTSRFGPSSRLVDVFPHQDRRSIWERLSSYTELKLPRLVRPNWLTVSACLLTVAISVLIAGILTGGEWTGLTFGIGFACLIIFGQLMASITEPFANQFDESFHSFRGFSERVLALNYAKFKDKHGPMGQGDVWAILRELVVETFCVDHDEVTPETDFLYDLGCD